MFQPPVADTWQGVMTSEFWGTLLYVSNLNDMTSVSSILVM